ncbi:MULTISPECIES: ABC transporter permease [Salipiger]|uniref:ABC nitrate/sulfonate/bicarbonate transporter, inner membrane subunit n=1 Tax=Salipiger bermudensis (strain DSM 26914 / JCM 13377 / KCTC 12554 / HTCC2601) TaxID=314265 RepID=Q0FIW2_SALBH|nr:ABC transporter permease [Salipiger bermudensis]EAU44161.1 ABC nitrate/sulfonate/bicarbonate transporter, inner membrane subunit [Salipiger bermudensis HTCC2601]MAE88503.1 ABC transporter permease [Pelagibaca sp.]MBN9676434.1 ABC transporter permease [Salipiger bermudensis]MBR9890800.1 ABC transporter permease [bacterium]
MRNLIPVLTVVAVIVAIWYAAAVWLNAQWVLDTAARQDREIGTSELVLETWSQDKPRLPAPHQVVTELWETTVEKNITSKRSLVYHAWVTLSATLAGFAMGTALGVALAVGIVYVRVMDMSVMPWVIASQTIPILAIAPMIIVVLNAMGLSGLLPKAMISMYLSFFPVVVGMVKGLRAPSRMQLDQMRTWNATQGQEFLRLRLPSSMPYLFASLKIAMAASLVGAIVGELPTGAVAGLGARLLAGSYYGQTIQIWSALFMAAIVAAAMVGLIGLVQRLTLKRMGMA